MPSTIDLVESEVLRITSAPRRGEALSVADNLIRAEIADHLVFIGGPHYSRQIGGGDSEATPGVWMHRIRAARDFDLLIFVDKTTPSS
jgi:hypothetical protein